MHEVLVNRLGGLSLPRKSVVRLTDRPDMTLDVYRGRKTTMQQQQQYMYTCSRFIAHALIGRLRRGAIKGFEVLTESRLNLHQAGSKVNLERAGYTVVGSKISTRLVLLDVLNF